MVVGKVLSLGGGKVELPGSVVVVPIVVVVVPAPVVVVVWQCSMVNVPEVGPANTNPALATADQLLTPNTPG